MPDLGALVLLLIVGGAVAALVATPFVRRARTARAADGQGREAADGQPARPAAPGPGTDDELEVLVIRHQVALEAVRDVEADWRAGSLDEAAHAEQRELAEQRAATTLADLEAARERAKERPEAAAPGKERRPLSGRGVALVALTIAAAAVIGFVVPPPFGLANPVRTNQALAAQLQKEQQRQATIQQLLTQLSQDPTNADALSKLADAYLAGSTADDYARGARTLLALLILKPNDASAYQRLITAYIQTGSWTNAASATDAYAKIAPDSPDIPFFRGLIASEGTNDPAEAARQFSAFLSAAPNDPRASMVCALLSGTASSAAPVPSACTQPSATPTPAP